MRIDKQKQIRRRRRKAGIRKRIVGTPERPRLTVYRSLSHTYAQIVDDLAGITLASASTLGGKSKDGGGNAAAAAQVGKDLVEKAKVAGITQVCFDRNGYRYHGRVRSVAEAVKEGGVKF